MSLDVLAARTRRDPSDLSDAIPVRSAPDESLVARVGWLIVAALAAAFYLPKLGFGFMTDEFLTVWVTDGSLGETIDRSNEFQGNSPLYFMFIWAWRQLVGSSEVMLRLPTIAATAAAIGVMARFARVLLGREGGVVAAIVLLGSSNLVIRATTARPYGFLLLFSVWSSYALWTWLLEGRRRSGITWVLALVGAVAMSPLAVGLGAAHLIWILDAHRRKSLPAGLGVLFGVGTVASLPMVPQMLALGERRASLVYSVQPTIEELLGALVPVTALVVVGLFVGVTGSRPQEDDRAIVRSLLAWSAVPVVVVYLLGALGDSPVWVDRYLVAGLPGGALLVAWAWTRIPSPASGIAVIALGLVSWLVLADFGDAQRHGWREAQQWAGAQVADERDVVLAQSVNLVETTDVALLDDPQWVPYLSASVGFSDGLDLPFVILPKESSGSAGWFDSQLPQLMAHETVVVIAGLNGVPAPDWFEIIREALVGDGYREQVGPEFAYIGVSIFRR